MACSFACIETSFYVLYFVCKARPRSSQPLQFSTSQYLYSSITTMLLAE